MGWRVLTTSEDGQRFPRGWENKRNCGIRGLGQRVSEGGFVLPGTSVPCRTPVPCVVPLLPCVFTWLESSALLALSLRVPFSTIACGCIGCALWGTEVGGCPCGPVLRYFGLALHDSGWAEGSPGPRRVPSRCEAESDGIGTTGCLDKGPYPVAARLARTKVLVEPPPL